jgi:hypothetical protein
MFAAWGFPRQGITKMTHDEKRVLSIWVGIYSGSYYVSDMDGEFLTAAESRHNAFGQGSFRDAIIDYLREKPFGTCFDFMLENGKKIQANTDKNVESSL